MLLYIQVQSIIGLIANQVTVSISFHKVSAAQSNSGKATMYSPNTYHVCFIQGTAIFHQGIFQQYHDVSI